MIWMVGKKNAFPVGVHVFIHRHFWMCSMSQRWCHRARSCYCVTEVILQIASLFNSISPSLFCNLFFFHNCFHQELCNRSVAVNPVRKSLSVHSVVTVKLTNPLYVVIRSLRLSGFILPEEKKEPLLQSLLLERQKKKKKNTG